MDCTKGAAKPIHSRTEIQKDLQQAGTSVSKDTISRNLHHEDMYSHGRAWVINFGGVSFMRDRIMDFFQHFSDKQKKFYSYQSSITFCILFTHVMYQFTIYFDLKYIWMKLIERYGIYNTCICFIKEKKNYVT